MVSVYDVAERAGVSLATVSRVLSGSSYPVRAETRARVLRSAEFLQFRPSMVARALATARTRTIGAIVHDVSDPYFGEVLRGVEDTARLDGYQVLVCSSYREPERELTYVKALLAHRVDTIVFAAGGIEDRAYQATLRALLRGYRANGGTVVMLAPHFYRAPSVLLDNHGGAFAMGRYLITLGHRRIGFVAGPPHLRTSAVRFAGFRAALAERGIGWSAALAAPGGFTYEGGARAVSELLGRHRDVTALFCANDLMAFGALHELARRGIRVPEEMSVAGFDDLQMAAYMSPPLTTVSAPLYELGCEGARLALDLLAGKRVRPRVLPVSVKPRESTAPVPRGRR